MRKLLAFTIALLLVPLTGQAAYNVQTRWAIWVENVDSSKIFIYSWDWLTIIDSQAGGPRTSSLINYDTTLSLNSIDSTYHVKVELFYPAADGIGVGWATYIPPPSQFDTTNIKAMILANFNLPPAHGNIRFIDNDGDNSDGLTIATAYTDFTKGIGDTENYIYYVMPGIYLNPEITITKSNVILEAVDYGSVFLRNLDDSERVNTMIQVNDSDAVPAASVKNVKILGFNMAYLQKGGLPADPSFQAAIWIFDSTEHIEVAYCFFAPDSTFKAIAIEDVSRFNYIHDNRFVRSRTHAIDAACDYSIFERNFIMDQRDFLGGPSGANTTEPIQITSKGNHNIVNGNYITSGSVLIRTQGDTNLIADNYLGLPTSDDGRELMGHSSLSTGNVFAGNWGQAQNPDTSGIGAGEPSLVVIRDLMTTIEKVEDTVNALIDSTNALMDSIGFSPDGVGLNLVRNPGFERDSVGGAAPEFWTQGIGTHTADITETSTMGGRWQFQIDPSANETSFVYQRVGELPAGSYWLSATGKGIGTSGGLIVIDNAVPTTTSAHIDSVSLNVTKQEAGKIVTIVTAEAIWIGLRVNALFAGNEVEFDNIKLIPIHPPQGGGSYATVIGATDTSGTDTLISNIDITLRDLAGNQIGAVLRTNTDGYVTYSINSDSFTVQIGSVLQNGHIWDAGLDTIFRDTLNVIDTFAVGQPTAADSVLMGFDQSITAPGAGNLCTVFGDIYDLGATDVKDVVVTVTSQSGNAIDTVANRHILRKPKSKSTDAAGHWEIILLRSSQTNPKATYVFTAKKGKHVVFQSKPVIVPDSATFRLVW